MNIEHIVDEKKFRVLLGKEEAHLLYRELPDGNLDFHSTFVPDSGRGMGLAKKIVEAGVSFAKKEGKKILPSCSYVKRYLESDDNLKSLKL